MTAPHDSAPAGRSPAFPPRLTAVARQWWWIPVGLLVAWIVAAAIGGTWVLIAIAVYTALNLLGTALLLREIRDQDEGPRSDRWRQLAKLAFVLQLPVGTIALLAEVL